MLGYCASAAVSRSAQNGAICAHIITVDCGDPT
jgi:hypothetical protein